MKTKADLLDELGIRWHEPQGRDMDHWWWPRERIIEAIQAWTKSHGEPPYPKQWVRSGEDHPCVQTVINSYDGSWIAALVDAGVWGLRRPKRFPSGTDRKRARARSDRQFDEETIVEIRVLADEGMSRADLAEEYECTSGMIGAIATGKVYKDIGGPRSEGQTGLGARKFRALTNEQVVEVRERIAAGELRKDLAAEYGVTDTAISYIVIGKSYAEVGGPRTQREDALTESQVVEIREAIAAGQTAKTLAAKYGVGKTLIGSIGLGQKYAKYGGPRKKARSRLAAADVIEIRRRVGSGEPQRVVAQAYGVSKSLVNNIVRGETWAHV